MSDTDTDNAPTIPPSLAAFVGAYVVSERTVTFTGNVDRLATVAADRCLLGFGLPTGGSNVQVTTNSQTAGGQGILVTVSAGAFILTSHHDPGLVWSAWYAKGTAGQVITIFEVFYRP